VAQLANTEQNTNARPREVLEQLLANREEELRELEEENQEEVNDD